MKRSTWMSVVLALLLTVGIGQAVGGVYTILDPAGSTLTQAFGVSGNNVVGFYENSGGADYGFLYNALTNSYTVLNPNGATNPGAEATGVDGNNVVGYYYNSSNNQTQGFLYNGSSYTTLNAPGGFATVPSGVSGNSVVGYYDKFQNPITITHGFLYNALANSYTTLDPPGSTYTDATGVSGNNVVGAYNNSSGTQGFLYNGSSYTTLNPTGAAHPNAEALGVSGNSVVGYYYVGGVAHGFLYNALTNSYGSSE